MSYAYNFIILLSWNFGCWVIFHAFAVVCWLFSKFTFVKTIISRTQSEGQMVWIQIRTYVLSVLIWVQTFAKVIRRWQVTTSKEICPPEEYAIFSPDKKGCHLLNAFICWMEKSEDLNKMAFNEWAADLVLHYSANIDIIKWLVKNSIGHFLCFVALCPKSTAMVMAG